MIPTTNYKPRAFMSYSSEKLHVTERFSRTGPETLTYEITVDDPLDVDEAVDPDGPVASLQRADL